MNKHILPVAYPTITVLTSYASALAILQSHEEALDWVYSHYLQMYVIKAEIEDITQDYYATAGYASSFFGDFDTRRLSSTTSEEAFKSREPYPFFSSFEIPYDMITTYAPSFTAFLKDRIDKNYYLYVYADTTEIREYGHWHEERSFKGHPMMIFGYDDEKGTFSIADFFQKGVYAFEECPYAEMEAALSSKEISYVPLGKRIESISAIQYNDEGIFSFDIGYVRETVAGYISPSPQKAEAFTKYASSYFKPLKWKATAIIGSDVYGFLSDFAKLYVALRDFGVTSIDIRPFHALYDHKAMMCKRLEYFSQKNYIPPDKQTPISEYGKIRDKAMIIRNMILKYNANPQTKILDALDKLLIETKIQEIELLREIFDI
jgi:hypothetical protein